MMENVDMMEAGRGLDALVAEKVMGAQVSDNDPLRGKGQPYCYWPDGRQGPPPRYSTDIAAAFEIVEKLRESDHWCCLDLHSNYSYAWEFILRVDEDHDPEAPHGGRKVSARGIAETAPLAICKAALKAVAAQTTTAPPNRP